MNIKLDWLIDILLNYILFTLLNYNMKNFTYLTVFIIN